MISAAAADGPKQEDGGVDLDLLLSALPQATLLRWSEAGKTEGNGCCLEVAKEPRS